MHVPWRRRPRDKGGGGTRRMIGSLLRRRAMRAFLFALAIMLAASAATADDGALERMFHANRAVAAASGPLLSKIQFEVHGDMAEPEETSGSAQSTLMFAELLAIRFTMPEATDAVVHDPARPLDSSFRTEVFRPPAA